MSITQKVFTSRTNSLDSESFVGEAGHLFYEQITTATGVAPVLKYSDGVTPGGIPIAGGGGVGNGYTGSQGIQGPADGYTGSQGTNGYVGSAGTNGSQGFVGSAGTNGTQGYTGSVGTGFTGSAGTNGTNGTQGYTGSQGEIGYVGSQGELGYVGSAGLDSIVPGYTGSQGELGYTGSQGELGYVGSQGELGYVGSQGELGYVGSQGLGTIVQSDTAPVPATTSTLWYDTIGGRSYVYFDDSWADLAPQTALTVTNVSYFTNDVGYLTSSTLGAYLPIDVDDYTTTATVNDLIANSLTNYATQIFVTSQGYITTASLSVTTLANGTNALTYNNGVFTFTPTDLSTYATETWVTNKNYLTAGAGMTALNATANQTVVEDLGLGVWRVGTVQDIGTTSTVRFGDLTVDNLNVLSTITNVVPISVDGYRLYLASTATSSSQINGGGIQLGNTATGIHSIFYNITHQHWDFDGDGIKVQHLEATVSTVTDLTVVGAAHVGYANLAADYPDTLLQLDAAVDGYAQVIFQNHSSSTQASADFVVTGDVGNDTTNYIDFGWANSRWDGSQPNSLGTALQANDGYLYAQGQTGTGNLVIGTTTPGSEVKLVVGGPGSENIVATFTTSSLNVDSINSLNSSTLSLNAGHGGVSVDSLNIPVGTILGSTTATVYTLLGLTLDQVVDYSQTSTDTLVVGEYGLLNGVIAPYAVYKFIDNPDPNLEVGDILGGAGIPNILPSGVLGYTGTVVLAVGTGTYSNYVVGFSDYSIYGLNPTLPTPGVPVLVGRNTQNANLSLTTLPVTDIALSPGVGGNVIVNSSIIPLTNNTYDLGSPSKRWRHVWVGAGTIYILDETLGSDTAIGARDGVVYLQGGTGLRVGEFIFKDNNIAISDPARDINFGVSTATGYLHFNRPVTIQDSTGRTAFTVTKQGLTTIIPPANILSTQSALSIIGNTAGIQQPRNYNNTMLQITGLDNTSTRVSIDSFGTGTYPVIAGRQAGGTVTAPSRTVSGDTLFRISTQGWGDTGYISAIGRMNFQALQNFTNSQAGTGIRFQLTPLNTTTMQTVTADITATGLSFVGNPIGGITFRDNTFQYTAFTSTNAVTRVFAGTGTYVSTSTGNITVWIDSYATTATVNTLIANSLTNYATQTYVTTRGYITSSSLSVATGSAVSGGALAYSTTTGVFTFNPATAYSLTTATSSALGGVKIGSGINAAGDGTISVTPFNTGTLVAHAVLADTATTSTSAATAYSTVAAHTAGTGLSGSTFNGSTAVSWTLNTSTLMAQAVSATTSTNAGYAYSFNTSTLVAQAVLADTVAGGIGVSSIIAGTATYISTSTGAVTIWAVPQAITSTGTTTASNYTIDLSGPTFIHWQPSANGNRTITLTGFTPGRRVEVFITPHTTNDIFTVSGVTTTQCSNGKNTFTMNGVGASQQNSFILQIYCTSSDISGVWIYGNGSL